MIRQGQAWQSPPELESGSFTCVVGSCALGLTTANSEAGGPPPRLASLSDSSLQFQIMSLKAGLKQPNSWCRSQETSLASDTAEVSMLHTAVQVVHCTTPGGDICLDYKLNGTPWSSFAVWQPGCVLGPFRGT